MNRPLLRLVRIWPMVMLVLVNAFLCWFSVPVDHKLISSTSCWLGRRKNVDKSGRQSTQLTRWCKPSKNVNINIIIVLVTTCNCQCWGVYLSGYNILREKPIRAESTNAIHGLSIWISSVEIALWAMSAPSFVHSRNLSYLSALTPPFLLINTSLITYTLPITSIFLSE